MIDLHSKTLTQNFIFNISFGKPFLCALSYKLEEKTLGPGEIVFMVSVFFTNILAERRSVHFVKFENTLYKILL